MTHRQQLLSVFRGETVDALPWVPRIDLWHNAQTLRGTMPERFEGMEVEEIHRALGWPLHKFIPEYQKPARPEDIYHRGIGLYDLKEFPYTFEFSSDVDIQVEVEEDETEEMTHVTYSTPVGSVSVRHGLTTEMKKAGASISWVKEHAIKGPEDYKVLAHIFGTLTLKPAYERYNTWRDYVGDDGIAVAQGLGIACTSPMHFIQKTFLDATEYYLHHHDYPDQMGELLAALEGTYDQLIDVLAGSGVDAVLWSANVDDMITYPDLYREYFLPWCHKAADRLSPEGILLIIHPDGENEGLMDLIAESRMDIADAVTPHPMTKVKIADYYDHWCRPGHLTIHGGIPEMLLLEESSTWDDLESYMDELFKVIAPGDRFVASIGDTTPPNADFDRLMYIGDRIEKEGRLPLAGGYAPIAATDGGAAPAVDAPAPAAAPSAAVSAGFEVVKQDVLDGKDDAIVVDVQALLDEGIDARRILETGMLPAMDIIGAQFADGTAFIPQVLLSARAMNEGLALLEPHLKTTDDRRTGKILIGTVEGDLHDIGKNMVVSMLKGVGYNVVDLGVNVNAKKFIEGVAEHEPDVVALSALLTTTMPQIKTVIGGLHEKGLRDAVKVIIGGAPVNQKYADDVGADGYAADAGEAVTLTKRLVGA